MPLAESHWYQAHSVGRKEIKRLRYVERWKTKKKPKETAPRFAVCIDRSAHPASLEGHKVYRVLPDEEAAQMAICGLSTKAVRTIIIPPRNSLVDCVASAVGRALLKAS